MMKSYFLVKETDPVMLIRVGNDEEEFSVKVDGVLWDNAYWYVFFILPSEVQEGSIPLKTEDVSDETGKYLTNEEIVSKVLG